MKLEEARAKSIDIVCGNESEKNIVRKILHSSGWSLDEDYNGGLVIGLMCDETYDIDCEPVIGFENIPASTFIASNPLA